MIRWQHKKRERVIYMRKKTKVSVKPAAALIAGLLLVACFTAACQPTPEKPPVAAKNNDLVETVVSANSEGNKQELEKDKQVINEQIKSVNGHMELEIKPNPKVTIHVDADIVSPEYEKIPLVRIKPKNFSKEQFETFIGHIAGGEPLFYETEDKNANIYSKEEIVAILTRLRKYLADGSLPDNIRSTFSERADDLENYYDDAISKSDEKPYDGELTEQANNKSYNYITKLKCYMGKDLAARFSLWQSFEGNKTQLMFSNTGYGYESYNTFEPYEGVGAARLDITYEEAKAMAEDLVRAIDGEDGSMTLYRSRIGYETGSITNYTKETSPQCYAFNFARSYGGVDLKPVSYLRGASEHVDYSKRVSPESVYIVIDNSGINTVSWVSFTEYIETVSEDTPLKDFETIKGIFEQHCNQKFTWVPHNDAIVGEAPPATLNVKRIELNLMAVPEKDNLESYITVPVWDFIADMEYDEEAVTQYGFAAEGEKDISILTINAIDGTIIDREQGY